MNALRTQTHERTRTQQRQHIRTRKTNTPEHRTTREQPGYTRPRPGKRPNIRREPGKTGPRGGKKKCFRNEGGVVKYMYNP